MHGFDRRHDAANEIEEASLFGNPAEHPGVTVAGKDMLKDRVAPVRDGANFDDVSEPLRAVVAGEFAEGSFHLFHVGEAHAPSITISASAGTKKSSPKVSDGVSLQRRSHDGADFGVIVDAERRDIQRTQIKCRVVADDDGDGRRPILFFVLTMDLPVMPGRHVQTKLPRSFHHVALEGDVVKASVGILHHRSHVDAKAPGPWRGAGPPVARKCLRRRRV